MMASCFGGNCLIVVVCLQLYVSCDISMEVAYYNERLAVWEPLIEPVENDGKYRPWELGLEVSIGTGVRKVKTINYQLTINSE